MDDEYHGPCSPSVFKGSGNMCPPPGVWHCVGNLYLGHGKAMLELWLGFPCNDNSSFLQDEIPILNSANYHVCLAQL